MAPLRPIAGLLAALALVIAAAGRLPAEEVIRGRTMGTTYQVQLADGAAGQGGELAARIARRLDEINRSMSTYLADSEINRFNRLQRAGEPFAVSEDFLRVMRAAALVHRLSGGAWDPTVAPLVTLWGFGPDARAPAVPDPARLAAARARVGFEKIEVRATGHLVKRVPGVSLDFNSIAKGYGVEQVAALLRAAGRRNFLVEIGGEVAAAGRRAAGGPWRVGINTPSAAAPPDAVYKVFTLSDAALATSGDYRNFFEIDGVRYSHVIDPRTGRPVANGVVSASVVAGDCTLADALATALMVLGAGPGIALADRLPEVEALVVVAGPDGRLEDHFSKGLR